MRWQNSFETSGDALCSDCCAGHVLDYWTMHNMSPYHNMSCYVWSMWCIKICMCCMCVLVGKGKRKSGRKKIRFDKHVRCSNCIIARERERERERVEGMELLQLLLFVSNLFSQAVRGREFVQILRPGKNEKKTAKVEGSNETLL